MGAFRAFLVTLLLIVVFAVGFFQLAKPPRTVEESTGSASTDATNTTNASTNATSTTNATANETNASLGNATG